MTRMTGGQAIVEMLRRNGVDTIFVLPGVQNDALFAALYDASEAGGKTALRVIHTRHEQAAAYMAFGYARASGKCGAYAVVPGPGFLNTTAALATAYATNAPVLCISGQIASRMIGRGYGQLHEIPDQLAILRGLTKWAAHIYHPTETGIAVDEAFRQMQTGRPRPVGLEMPPDVMALETEVVLPEGFIAPAPATPDPDLIEKAAERLGNSKNPLIMVGSGASGAAEALLAVASLIEAPVFTSYGGKGIVSDRHYLSQNAFAGHELWGKADVVLGVGSRMAHPLMQWGVDEALDLIRIDIDPTEIARIVAPSIGIVADARAALTALHDALLRHNRKRPSREAELTALKKKSLQEIGKLSPQCQYLMAIRRELPDEGVFVDELTQVGYVARLAYPTYRPRTFIHSGYQGTLGFGFPTALGAKIARPEAPVVSISGDGGFLYNAQELASAALHGIDIVAIVFVDGAFGNVRRIQKEDYGNRLIAVELRNPDFARMAESYGVAGISASGPEGLQRELNAALKRRGPTLIEVKVGEMPDPWPVILRPRVRGK
ncbi:MAG TPA: thiamine pyrophosphate-dependent enzyme [Alphaproteobacteria bacterium]|nr:thiamine pyrophosphate-dependent enzyme [Alphaproteobacteria bacterium]